MSADAGALLMRELMKRCGFVRWTAEHLIDHRRRVSIGRSVSSLLRRFLPRMDWRHAARSDADHVRREPDLRTSARDLRGCRNEIDLASRPTLFRSGIAWDAHYREEVGQSADDARLGEPYRARLGHPTTSVAHLSAMMSIHHAARNDRIVTFPARDRAAGMRPCVGTAAQPRMTEAAAKIQSFQIVHDGRFGVPRCTSKTLHHIEELGCGAVSESIPAGFGHQGRVYGLRT